MKEYLKIVLEPEYAHLLLEGCSDYKLLRSRSDSVMNIEMSTDSDVYKKLQSVYDYVDRKYDKLLFYGWKYVRKYTAEELMSSRLFLLDIRKWFSDSCGKEHGTVYDDSHACPVCHSGERQVSPLYLPKGRYMLHRDVILTFGYEIVVSKRFMEMCKDNSLKGLTFGPVYFGKTLSEDYFQLMNEGAKLEIAPETKFGVTPCLYKEKGPEGYFPGKSEVWEGGPEIYKCPKGDNLGFDILSSAYVLDCEEIDNYDFFISRQTYGVYRWAPIPRHLLFCSPHMRKLIIENQIKGFDFEIANIV